MLDKLLSIPVYIAIILVLGVGAVFFYIHSQEANRIGIGVYTHPVTHAPKNINFEASSSASMSATPSAKVKLNGPTKH